MGNSSNYQLDRETKIAQRDQSLAKFIPVFEQIIHENKIENDKIELITRSTVEQLVKQLNQRKVTSLELVAIFGIRAATIGKALCVITEDYFEFALSKAKQCDQDRSRSGKRNWQFGQQWNEQTNYPPLYGIPISIKENIDMKGTTSTVGLTSRAFDIKSKDSPYIICMKKTGAIPFIKTNLPQIAMNFDSQNFLWGEAKNPWNTKKSCGGSSGGEGGCLAARISVIGIGNDIGGSLRIPSTFCGTTALLPSQDRIFRKHSITKYSTGFTGMDSIKAVNGPMSTSVEGLALWMKLVTNIDNFEGATDPYINLLPFNDKRYLEFQNKKHLRIGYLVNLNLIECTPSSQRAIKQAIEFLKNDGHELIPIQIPREKQTIFSFFTELVGEGKLKSLQSMLKGQKLSKNYKTLKLISSLNPKIFSIFQWIMKKKQPRIGQILEASRNRTAHEYLLNAGTIHQIKDEWTSYWTELKLDAAISPGFGSEATNHGFSDEGSLIAAYTFIWNVLGMTVGSLPTTLVRQNEQYYDSVYSDDITNLIMKTVKDSAGLPNGIQVIGLPFKQEEVLGIMKRLENHFQFIKNHPYPNL